MLRTAEFVSPLHPDKICDRISDAIVDECLRQDQNSRCAVEVMGGHGIITVTGELTTEAYVDIPLIVKKVIPSFRGGVQVNLVKQSPEIARGVDIGGAGDQGIMIGYACNETDDFHTADYWHARDLCKFLYSKWPEDGKVQITLDGFALQTALISWSNVEAEKLRSAFDEWLEGASKLRLETAVYKLLTNPAGDWYRSGFDADTGVTGRKIVMDAYGPNIPVGGGAFSGKDGTKVDRSGAYKARQLAVKVLSSLDLKEALVKVTYAIGEVEPTTLDVMARFPKNERFIFLKDHPDLYTVIEEAKEGFTPQRMITDLGLALPIFEETASWGHFGNGNVWDRI